MLRCVGAEPADAARLVVVSEVEAVPPDLGQPVLPPPERSARRAARACRRPGRRRGSRRCRSRRRPLASGRPDSARRRRHRATRGGRGGRGGPRSRRGHRRRHRRCRRSCAGRPDRPRPTSTSRARRPSRDVPRCVDVGVDVAVYVGARVSRGHDQHPTMHHLHAQRPLCGRFADPARHAACRAFLDRLTACRARGNVEIVSRSADATAESRAVRALVRRSMHVSRTCAIARSCEKRRSLVRM